MHDADRQDIAGPHLSGRPRAGRSVVVMAAAVTAECPAPPAADSIVMLTARTARPSTEKTKLLSSSFIGFGGGLEREELGHVGHGEDHPNDSGHPTALFVGVERRLNKVEELASGQQVTLACGRGGRSPPGPASTEPPCQ